MKYVATAVVSFGAGSALGLTKPQADARVASLQPIEGRKGWYTTSAPVQFKRGEEFQHDGDLPKAIATDLGQAETERKRRTAAERQAAEQAGKRQELLQHIAALEEAIDKAQEPEAKVSLQEQLAAAKADLQAMG